MTEPRAVSMLAEVSTNLDTTCYRGSAPLADLTYISTADVYDQDLNPNGLQREFSRKHALDAYEFVAAEADPKFPRAFPEVVLNVRDKGVVTVEAAGEVEGVKIARLTFDLDKIERAKTVKVSRVDGNHRLLFGAGDGKDRGPLDAAAPFQIHVGLTPEQEGSMFLDINANQKGLNTSHLHSLRSRLTPEDVELERHPERVYARNLATDVVSPWCGLVHLGGSKQGAKDAGIRRPVNFVALESGTRRLLTKSVYLKDMSSHDARYGLIRGFWLAVRELLPEGWATPAEYLVLKNIGVTALSTFGATVVDRAMAAGDVDPEDMLALMLPAKDAVDWHKDSPDVAGRSGNRAALYLAEKMVAELPKPRKGELTTA